MKLCLSKIKFLEVILGAVSLLWKKDNEQDHCDRKCLNIIFNIYYLRAEVSSDLFVASGEGPKFFQNLHQSINVLLRIYELEIRAKRQPNLFSTKIVNSVDDRSIYTLDSAA
ncbi:hypothetical protein Avbf_15036 [Armadillidium vulgare]|nr:hypothetical protein Avbf_15036 [Armadillidium vulgare]